MGESRWCDMVFPFVFVESERSVDRAEAVRARLIPATIAAVPIRTFRREISLTSFVFASGVSVFDCIVAVPSSFELPTDLRLRVLSRQPLGSKDHARTVHFSKRVWGGSTQFLTFL